MDESGPGPNNIPDVDIMDVLCDGPVTVLDQAMEDAEQFEGECSNLLLGRMFGAPQGKLRACKTCIGFKSQNGSTVGSLLGYSAEEIENITCSEHLHEKYMEEREKAKCELEAKLARKAKQEQDKLRREILKAAKSEKIKKACKKDKDNKNAEDAKNNNSFKKTVNTKNAIPEKKTKTPNSKSSAVVKISKNTFSIEAQAKTNEQNNWDFPQESVKIEINDDDIDEYMRGQIKPKKKKSTIWLCPDCKKSSKFGSCGCYSCGEWYHTSCAGFKKAAEVPDNWICRWCK